MARCLTSKLLLDKFAHSGLRAARSYVKVLIAGGAGNIGSTVGSACLDAGIIPVILDNLVTGRREFARGRAFYEGDICDGALIDKIFTEHPDISAVVHCDRGRTYAIECDPKTR